MKLEFSHRLFFVLVFLLCSACLSNADELGVVPDNALVDYFEKAGTGFSLFDDDGVVLVDYGGDLGVQYNPVFIAQAALAYYYEYRNTRSEVSKKHFVNQINWLVQSSHSINEEMAAYPFNFKWGELEPGWYSGLGQAQAISALIRAYYLFDDKSLLPLIKRLKNFMFLPKSQGGVATETPEGGIWIEEFPFKIPSHVLNGFMYSILSLYEYTHLIKDDEQTQQLCIDCLNSLKTSLHHYDTGNWHNSDRYYNDPATENYVATHTEQLFWLWKITGDSFFNHVRMRWLAFSMERTPFNKSNVVRREDGSYYAPPKIVVNSLRTTFWDDVKSFSTVDTMQGYGVKTLFDDNPSTYFAPEVSDISVSNPHFISMKLIKPIKLKGIKVRLYNPSLYPREVSISTKNLESNKWQEHEVETLSHERDILYSFQEVTTNEITFSTSSTVGQDRLILAEIDLDTSEKNIKLPKVGNYLSDTYFLSAGESKFSINVENLDNAGIIVNYRCTSNLDSLYTALWSFAFLTIDENKLYLDRDSYCQFRITYNSDSGTEKWSSFDITPQL